MTATPATTTNRQRRRLASVAGVSTVALALASLMSAAWGSWQANQTGGGAAKAASMPTGQTPSATASGRDVTVSWAAANLGTSPAQPVGGYVVKRYDSSSNALQTILSNCTGVVAALTCTESSVPVGSWKYSVTPRQQNWAGTEGTKSSAVTLSSGVSFTPTSVDNSGGTGSQSAASVTGFVDNESVTFRLDATNGTSIGTATVGATGGTAAGTITIPSGTSVASHTVYAMGGSGSQASASITVTAAPASVSLTSTDVSSLPGSLSGTASLFGATETLNCKIDANPATSCGTTNASGTASISKVVPASAAATFHTLTVTGATSAKTASVQFSVGPVPSGLFMKGGTAGRIDSGDTIIVTWTEALDLTSVCEAGTTTFPTTSTISLTMTVTNGGGGNDSIAPSGQPCKNLNKPFNLGAIDLGSTAWVTADTNYTLSTATYCSAHTAIGACSDAAVQGPAIVIQLGTGASSSTVGAVIANFTPSSSVKGTGGLSASGLATYVASPSQTQF